ncbi:MULTISPECIES: hypothetical protein [Bacteroides]|uniref:hypothetical protein n=1 Tax=Bacteroides TaxID=816 RepID=UPI001E18920E|nr:MULTISPECIES: hypothetical protein [Bacteroides]HJD92127.1 hypothetical protein [Bacteroides coprosuis]
MPIVKNIKDKSLLGGKPMYSTDLLKKWESKTGENPSNCSAQGCYGRDLVGVQVQESNNFFDDSYVVPVCKSCAEKDTEYYVSSELVKTEEL